MTSSTNIYEIVVIIFPPLLLVDDMGTPTSSPMGNCIIIGARRPLLVELRLKKMSHQCSILAIMYVDPSDVAFADEHSMDGYYPVLLSTPSARQPVIPSSH